MAKKNKKAKKQNKKNSVASAIKKISTAASGVAKSNKTYKETVKKNTNVQSLVQQGTSATANAAAQQAAAIAAAKKKQEQKKAAAKNAVASSMKNTKAQQQKRGGVVLAGNKNQRQKSAAEARANLLKATGNDKKTKEKIKEQKGKEKTALGTINKKTTKTYDTGYGVNNDMLKIANATRGVGQTPAMVEELKKQGYSESESQKVVNAYVKSEVDKANKEIDKIRPAKVKYSYEGMTQEEYNKLAVASQQGRLNDVLKSDEKLAKKVADLNVRDYVKGGAFDMGVLDQMTQGLSVSQNPVYDYSDDQKLIMERQKTRKGTGYNAGRMVGAMAEFGLGGTGTIGSGLAKTVGKTALKEAAEQGGKSLAKTTAKNIAKETAGDTVASLGLNTLDALKFSYKDGKFDKKEFAKELALNVGGDILIGGAVSGLTHGLSAVQVKNFNRINKALSSGKTVSDAEIKFYNKHLNELGDKVDTAVKTKSAQDEDFAKQVDDVIVGNSKTGEKLTVGQTPEKLQEYGASNADMTMKQGAVTKIAYPSGYISALKGVDTVSHGHNLGVGAVKKIRERLEDPVAIFKSDTQPDSFVVITENIDSNGNPVIAAIHLDKDGNIGLENEIASMYGKDNFADFVKQQREKGNVLYESNKKSLDDLPRTGLQLPGEGDLLDPINTIYKSDKNVNPREAKLEEVSGTTFADAATKANDDIEYTTFYKTEAERLKAENPSPDKAFADAQRISKDEVPQARQTAVKLVNQVDDDVADIIEPWVKDGLMNKKVLQSQEEAIQQAEKELADGRLYDNFIDSKVESDEHLFMARAKVLLEDLMKKAPESNEASEMLLNAMEKATEASSHAGRLLNATKLLLRNTPKGRARIFSKEIERLNKKFASRLKNGELKLTPQQEQRILNATDETIEEVAEQINKEIWEEIPATWFEKFNEIRHTSMLFNAKTHIRNVTGNAVFWQARLISDGLEIAMNKIPAVRKRIENLGGKTEMVHVTRKELSDNKAILNEIFEQNYQKSGSKTRYIESSRPDGAPIVKNRVGNWIIQTNYKLLEKEDLLTFKPEYRKNFIRWCKANGVPLNDISKLTKEQMQKADAYAIRQAERATFRDDSAFASKIVGLKQKTAEKKGKTVLGTAAYRGANIFLESNLPFVKTPVNILRRSVDYSPLGMARSAVELATAKTADDFMQGVHHLATGLTGSGVFALGMWLANRDLITVTAGEESGDAYYDRDMGYQDYSLVVGGDNKFSITIDWLSPMQTSLFMGAEAWNDLSEGNWTLEDMFDGLTAMTGPMLDMSFMSTAKDTLEMFQEKVYRNGTGDDADWSGAIFQTLFGSVPQGYLNSFVPQVFSQTAQAFDNKQRDTRSTKEDPVAASWDSWKRKMINKIPGLRNYLLNPKLDRFGNDKTTGNNIVTRFLNAYVNPSNVKRINHTDTDKEIIKIYNHLEDGSDAKKEYYYYFTGNPFYDLGNGKRMTYDDAYKYGKESRRQQTKMIEDMIGSKSYKNMTWAMKASEVKGANDIGQTYADRKTYGNKYARNQIMKYGSTTDQRAAKLSKTSGMDPKEFVDFYLTKETLINRSHDSDWETKALAVALSGNDEMAKIYDINMDKVKIAKEYLSAGGSKKEYSNAMCNVISKINEEEATVSKSNIAVAAAYYDINERTYTAMGLSEKANMGVGLKNFGYTFSTLEQMKMDSKYLFDSDGSGSIDKDELMAYIDSLGLSSREEKACVFAYFSTAKNPYGSIPNYLGFGNTSSSGGSGGSYGRSSGKSSKTAEEKTAKSNLPSWEDYVKDFITESEKVSGVNFKDWDSPLDQAYRNKINSILKKMEA